MSRWQNTILNKDSIVLGVFLGAIVPFVGYAIFLTLFDELESAGIMSDQNMSENFRLRTVSLMAVSLNLIPLAIYNRMRFVNTMRGFVFPTMVYVVSWFLVYGRHLISV